MRNDTDILKLVGDLSNRHAELTSKYSLNPTSLSQEEVDSLYILGILANSIRDSEEVLESIFKGAFKPKEVSSTTEEHAPVSKYQTAPIRQREPDLSMGVGMALGGLLQPIVDIDPHLEDQQVSEFHHMMNNTDFDDI